MTEDERTARIQQELTRLRAAIFGGKDRPEWSIESVIALAQAHREDSDLLDWQEARSSFPRTAEEESHNG